jgi:hypothetical protein
VAGKFDLVVEDYAELEEEIASTDIMIVANWCSKLLFLKLNRYE